MSSRKPTITVSRLRAELEAATITAEEFRTLMDLFMCSDPWPLSERAHATTIRMLDRLAAARGYDSWITACHEHEPKSV